MWKRIVIIMISVTLFSNLLVSASERIEDNLCNNVIMSIAPYIAEDGDAMVTRGDCVAAIMKLVGVDEETAENYADMDFDEPVFSDVAYNDVNAGYIILANFSNVALGTKSSCKSCANCFEPDRNVTVKECLAFMLRCLNDPEAVLWDNIMEDSVKQGLLQEDELALYAADQLLQSRRFYTLLYRMLNKNRYLYWPTEEPPAGYAKSMKVDLTNSIKYCDWFVKIG